MQKLAVNWNAAGQGIPMEEELDAIREAGFDGIFPIWATPGTLGKLKKAADERGLTFQSLHSRYQNCDAMWDEHRAKTELLYQMACLEECADLGVDLLVCHVWIGFDPVTPTDTGIRSFEKLLNEAEKRHIRIALENTEGENCLQYLRDHLWQHPAVGFCWDSGHEQCYNERQDMLAKYGDKLLGTHLNDNYGRTTDTVYWWDDTHLLPGDGVLTLPDIASRLGRCPELPWLTTELTRAEKPNRHTGENYRAMTVREYYRAAWERVNTVRTLMAEKRD